VLKDLGLLSVSLAAAYTAWRCAAGQRERRTVLSALLSDISLLKLEICERLLPLPEALEKLSKEKVPCLRAFFSACAKEIRTCENVPFSEIWSLHARKELSEKLGAEELEAAAELGRFLGRYEAGQQREELEKAERRFEGFLRREQTQGAARGRLKAAVSLCAGAVAVILML